MWRARYLPSLIALFNVCSNIISCIMATILNVGPDENLPWHDSGGLFIVYHTSNADEKLC